MELEETAHDLYLRHTDKNGKSRIECHRVWDAAKFLEATDKAARHEGGSISVVTPVEYLNYRRSIK